MLQEYWRKRDLKKTPEPKGKPRRSAKIRRPLEFVVQKHSARRLHFDFRLETDGVLVSWAVPKGPSMNPADKHLAIHVEDHPFEYRKFEGIIPAGQYGAGEVIVWDRGTYEPENAEGKSKQEQIRAVNQAIEAGKLTIRLHGERLNGLFTLVRLSSRSGDKEQWLLFKKNDEFADPESRILENDRSVQSDTSLLDLQRENGKIVDLAGRDRKLDKKPMAREKKRSGGNEEGKPRKAAVSGDGPSGITRGRKKKQP